MCLTSRLADFARLYNLPNRTLYSKYAEMPSKEVDYSLYLVTDSTPAILGDKDLVSVVRDAIAGGRLQLPLYASPAAHI